MSKKFNVTANCDPSQHYMVDIQGKLEQIKKMVDAGDYFTINRARQYGKTTTLRALGQVLMSEYVVASLDFQRLDEEYFEKKSDFVKAFARELSIRILNKDDVSPEITKRLVDFAEGKVGDGKLTTFFLFLSEWCRESPKPVVLLIDEVDSASKYPVFLSFLAQLREGYINRSTEPTFHSVVLTGVNDIRNIQLKIRPNEAHKVNDLLHALLFQGKEIRHNPDRTVTNVAIMFGFAKVENGFVTVANRIFETRLYNWFLATMQEEDLYDAAASDKNQFLQDGRLNMALGITMLKLRPVTGREPM